MAEPFFGSVPSSPLWPGIPYPGFAFQMPVGIGSRPIGISAEAFASPQIPQATTAGMPAVGQSFPMAGAAPSALPPSSFAFVPPAYGIGAMVPVPLPGSALGQVGPAYAPNVPSLFGTPGVFPGFGGYGEAAPGLSAPALLAAVALRRGQPLGPTSDNETEEFIYDALELLHGTNDVEVRCEGGRVTLTGTVQHKRLKRDAGEIAWAMLGVNDVVNNVTIAARRRPRGTEREAEPQPAVAGRKQTT
jgi:BON domain